MNTSKSLLLILFFVQCACLFGQPIHIYKVAPGNPFFPFKFSDIHGKTWSLQELKGKPTIIITAHRDVRYDLELWARALVEKFGPTGKVHLLWVVDLSKYLWCRDEVYAERFWANFRAPIPVVLDWHAQVGRALRISFKIPNIIGIDCQGRLAFHERFPFRMDNFAIIVNQINLLLENRELPGRGYSSATTEISETKP